MAETSQVVLIVFMLAASALAGFLSLRALRLRHKVFWALSFTIMCAGAFIWLLSNTARLLSSSDIVWNIVHSTSGMGISMSTFGLMTFSLQISLRRRRLPRLVLFGFPPLLILFSILSWTNDLHGLMWTGPGATAYGLLMPFSQLVTYSQVAVALAMLARSYLTRDDIYRAQTGYLLLGVIAPVLVGLMEDVFHLDPIREVDEAALATMLTVVVFALATLRYKAFAVIPVAYKLLIDRMQDGLVVLDLDHLVMLFNPSARRFFGEALRNGVPFEVVLAGWSPEAQAEWVSGNTDYEVRLNDQARSFYRLAVHELAEKAEESAGKMVTLYDITWQKQLENSLHELAVNDPLTGCFNRGHFIECAGKQLRQARRYHRPLSVAMIDLDHFKQVNDLYGHAVGDQVLKRVVSACLASLRRSDIFARYGGEEFVLMMPETGADEALLVAERLREAIGGQYMHGAAVTASIGVVSFNAEEEVDLDVLLDRADQAQYRSKTMGRDRVTLWKK
jgi:diguanylate cyclase (GGDEF)-like protein